MRFGRRNKMRPVVGGVAVEESAGRVGGAVASAERNALLGAGGGLRENGDFPAPESEGVDSTQRLLTALGRFQRELSHASHGGTAWCDEAMDQLIAGVEVAIEEGWPVMVEALTNTGRVLQTYENAGRPAEALPFLNDAYELLCLMVGDLIVGEVRAGVREKWAKRYEKAVKEVERTGLQLIADDEDGAGGRDVRVSRELDTVAPFAAPEALGEDDGGVAPGPLDELPPLEEMLVLDLGPRSLGPEPEDERSDAGVNENDFGLFEEEEAEWAAEGRRGTGPAGPPRIVVEILDRISDHLAGLERSGGADLGLALERLRGGVRALRREAREAGDEHAEALCESMQSLCEKAASGGAPDERFVDLAYGFCGVFTDTLVGGDIEAGRAWRDECEHLIATWRGGDVAEGPPAPETPEAALLERIVEQAAECAVVDETSDSASVLEVPFDHDESVSSPGPSASVVDNERAGYAPAEEVGDGAAFPVTPFDESAVGPVIAEDGPSEVVDEPETPDLAEFARGAAAPVNEGPAPIEGPEPIGPAARAEEHAAEAGPLSFRLLESARKAFAEGDGARAKSFALRAAAAIAREEAERAEQSLREAEARLKANLASTESARLAVKEAEAGVRSAAGEVAAAEKDLGAAQDGTARVAQELEDRKSLVAGLEEQIRALEAQRAAALDEARATEACLSEARRQAEEVQARLEARRRAEAEARRELEGRRQDVKNTMRATQEIESALEEARRRLEKQLASLADIEGTIRHIEGDGAGAEAEDRMLF